MALHAVEITKSVSFRGVQQEFSNRYTFDGPAIGQSQAATLAANVKAIEVNFHSSDVSFLRWAVWSTGGSPGSNQMVDQGDLSGLGNQVGNSSMDRERAFLIRWPAGFDVRGRPVFLRKWYHSCGAFNNESVGTTVLQQTAEIPAAVRTAMAAGAAALNSVSDGTSAHLLCGPTGRARQGAPEMHQYLEHHQLGDMWRG